MSSQHNNYRLNFDQLKIALKEEFESSAIKNYKYIYLYAFNHNDILLWATFIPPEAPSYHFYLTMTEPLFIHYDRNHIYFILKVKYYNNFLEATADMSGTMEMAKGFIKSWKDFPDKDGLANPVLKRFMVDFINLNLGLPYKYSLEQRLADERELLKESHPATKSLKHSIWNGSPIISQSSPSIKNQCSWWQKIFKWPKD